MDVPFLTGISKVTEMPRFIKRNRLFSCWLLAEEELGLLLSRSQQCAAVAPKGHYWLGCIGQGLTHRYGEELFPAELLGSHTQTNPGIQHRVLQAGRGSSTCGCTEDWVCNLSKSVIAAFNQL